jgi:hypothetical protein
MGLGSRMRAMHLASEHGCSDEGDSCDEETREAFECGSEYAVTHACMRCGGAIADALHFRGDDADEFPVTMSGPRKSKTDAIYDQAQRQEERRKKLQYKKEIQKKEYAAQKKAIDKRVDQSKYGYEDWQNGVNGANPPGGIRSRPAPKATVKAAAAKTVENAKNAAKTKVLSGLESMGFGRKK